MKRARSSLPFGDWMKSCGATHLPSCRLQQQSDKICGLSPLPTSPSLLLPCSLSSFYYWKIWGSFSCFLLKATLELSFNIRDSYNLEVHREHREQEWRRRRPKWQMRLHPEQFLQGIFYPPPSAAATVRRKLSRIAAGFREQELVSELVAARMMMAIAHELQQEEQEVSSRRWWWVWRRRWRRIISSSSTGVVLTAAAAASPISSRTVHL